VVKRAVNKKTKAEVAVKIIDKTSIDVRIESLKTEVRVLMNIEHPNIVNLIDVFEDENKVYLVMNLMTGGELFDRICQQHPNGYSEKQASQLIRKIIVVVQYLHSKGIIHRDLKPENLLFSSPAPDAEIKMSDFGLAKIWRGDMLVKTACGSPNYVAPEVLLNEMHGYSFAVDMWSVGVILYVLCCGFCPFFDENTPALFSSITRGKYSFPSPYWDSISAECKHLISQLLVVDPKKRYTPEQALQHPWILFNENETPIANIHHNMEKFKSSRSKCSFDMDDLSAIEDQEGCVSPKANSGPTSPKAYHE
jgi:calcium/calmodulin-dependent protein kinase I